MGRPNKDTVYAASAAALADLAEPTRSVGSKLLDAANNVHAAMSDLEWEGEGRDASLGRAERELAQDKQVVHGHDALADAYRDGAALLQPMITDLTTIGQGLEADSFDVSQDWVVSDLFNYQAGQQAMSILGVPGATAAAQLSQLKAQRAEEARAQTVNLQRRADDLGAADQQTVAAITKAKTDIESSAPPAAGLAGGNLAAEDFKAVQDGKATREQRARVAAAMSSFTEDQRLALAQGRPATMPQGQFDYLRTLMHSMDGMSTSEINDSMKKAGLQGQMGDTIRMLGNPNLQTANGDRGGLGNEPKAIQKLLTDDPVKSYDLGRGHGGRGTQVPLSQFNALDEMLGHGNQDLRQGSDVDRALLNQASKLAHVDDPNWLTENRHDWLSARDVNNTVDAMVTNASGDHQAVTDFLNGANDANSVGATRMNEATAGHFEGNQAFLNLTTRDFENGQHGVDDMFDWIGNNAYTPGLEGHNAALAADSTAHLLSRNHDVLGQHMPEGSHAGNQTLGQVNPELTRTLTKNLIPYVGNLGGVEIPGIDSTGIRGFSDVTDLKNMIKVLDSDPASAQALNRAAAGWENYYAERFGETSDPQYARAAGQLTQAVQGGNQAELDALKANKDWDAIRAYNDRSGNWDTVKGILSGAASVIPGGGAAVTWGKALTDVLNPELKLDSITLPSDPANMKDNEWQAALKGMNSEFTRLTDGQYHNYSLVSGYAVRDPNIISAFQNIPTNHGPVNFFDENGQLNWQTVTENRQYFDYTYSQLKENGQLRVGGWDDSNVGYDSGLRDPNIDPARLPNPGNVAIPPGGQPPR